MSIAGWGARGDRRRHQGPARGGEGTTEDKAVCLRLVTGLRDRGLDAEGGVLFVIVGAKALAAASAPPSAPTHSCNAAAGTEAVKNQRVDVPVFAGAVEGVMEARSSVAVR